MLVPSGRSGEASRNPPPGREGQVNAHGAPSQTPELNALAPRWPCRPDICGSLIRCTRGKPCHAYSKEGRPKAREAIRPRFHPEEGRASNGPVTIASPDSAVNLIKNVFDGGKDRGALQSHPCDNRARFGCHEEESRQSPFECPRQFRTVARVLGGGFTFWRLLSAPSGGSDYRLRS